MSQLSRSVTRLENAIFTLSGPALATSGIIAGVDILTNNLIARYAPGAGAIAGLVWAICLMLTLDFQVLMLGVRAHRIYVSKQKGGWQKAGELVLCVAIAAALGYGILRNFADARYGTLKVCAVFHHPRFLQTTHLLFLIVLVLVLSVLIFLALMEHAKLEQIELGATIHAPFNQLEPIHMPFERAIAPREC